MYVFSKKTTSKGGNIGATKILGGGLRMNRTMRLATQGNGLKKEFYDAIENIEDKTKAYSPDLVKKFGSIKIRSGKPKSYITF